MNVNSGHDSGEIESMIKSISPRISVKDIEDLAEQVGFKGPLTSKKY